MYTTPIIVNRTALEAVAKAYNAELCLPDSGAEEGVVSVCVPVYPVRGAGSAGPLISHWQVFATYGEHDWRNEIAASRIPLFSGGIER